MNTTIAIGRGKNEWQLNALILNSVDANVFTILHVTFLYPTRTTLRMIYNELCEGNPKETGGPP